MIAYKPKRGRFSTASISEITEDKVKAFVDDVFGGGGQWQKVDELSLKGSKEEL